MVEPIFEAGLLPTLSGKPKIYDQVSAGSGKIVHIHFCPDSGTRLWLSFERFPGVVGLYAGTFDDPCWFPIEPETSKHIFLGVAQADTVIPPGLPTFVEHATPNDGTPQEATVYEACHRIGAHQAQAQDPLIGLPPVQRRDSCPRTQESMMSSLFWLTDEQIGRLRPHFPESHGKPRVDDRRVLSGIIFINRNGCAGAMLQGSRPAKDALQSLEAVERHGRLRPNDGRAGFGGRGPEGDHD